MNARDISHSVKKATVAVMTRRENSGPGHPFKIIGSGFCVHPDGIVITANHVFQTFVKDQHHKSVLARVPGRKRGMVWVDNDVERESE
jgi:hypothetical protein